MHNVHAVDESVCLACDVIILLNTDRIENSCCHSTDFKMRGLDLSSVHYVAYSSNTGVIWVA